MTHIAKYIEVEYPSSENLQNPKVFMFLSDLNGKIQKVLRKVLGDVQLLYVTSYAYLRSIGDDIFFVNDFRAQ